MRKRWSVLLCLLLGVQPVVGGGIASSQSVSPRDGVSGWRAFHWSKPKHEQRWIVIRDSTRTSWSSRLWSALETWGKSRKIAFIWKPAPTDRDTRRRCGFSGGYGVIHICNSGYRWNDAARVGVKVNGGDHILKGRIKLNNAVAGQSRRSVVCHELGHALGLTHRATRTSCMYNGINDFPDRPDIRDFFWLRYTTHRHRHVGRIPAAGTRVHTFRDRLRS